MVTRVLDRKLLRDLIRHRGQAIAVIMVITCGTASYICMGSAYRNLLLTRDAYYAEYRFADFEIHAERVPLTALFKIETLPGVRRVQGRIVQDINLDMEHQDGPRVGRLVSLPDRREPTLNDICLVSGRYFDKAALTEAIVSDAFAQANTLRLGDRIRAVINNRKYALRVVGTALSPEYVYMIRNVQEMIPSPERFGVLWVSQSFAETALDMTGACNNIVGIVEDQKRLDGVLQRAERLLDSCGVVAAAKRDDQISHRFLSDEIRGGAVSAKIAPSIFLSIAALVLLVMLDRMVQQEHTQIGLLKAYGYSSWTVSACYVKFALILGVLGCLGGFVLGEWLAGEITKMYIQFYNFPVLRSRLYPDVLVMAMGLTILFALAGALGAARRAARIRPAEAMRAKPPRYGSRTLLERADVIWRRLSFTWKMIVRNMSRYRFRAAITAFGVMVSSAIMLFGFSAIDSMRYMLAFQFHEVQREDMKVMFEAERGKNALYEATRWPHVRRVEPLLQYPFEVRSDWRKKDLGIVGLPRHAQLMRLTDTSGRRVDIGDSGLIISDRLAEELGVRPGSLVTLKSLTGRVTGGGDEAKTMRVPIGSVIRQYVGMAAYMNLDALSRLLDEPFAMNTALLRVDPNRIRDVTRHLKDITGVTAVEIKADAYASIQATLAESLRIMNSMLTIFAGVIAFAVIYNVTVVSVAERQRELASLRVMGFSTAEVGRIVYHENFFLSACGLSGGIPLGMVLCWWLIRAYDTDLYRLPFYIDSRTYVVTVLLTACFVVLANWAARRRIIRLDMVEVLKERE